jgi:hypothetical protein
VTLSEDGRPAGCTGTIIARMDSAFCNAAVIGAIRYGGARFSVTAPMNADIRAAIAAIPGDAWTPDQPRPVRTPNDRTTTPNPAYANAPGRRARP